MFLATAALPRYDYHSKKYFDGKIETWAFVHAVEAQRNSSNRPTGTIEKKSLNVTGDIFLEYLR